MDDEVTFKGSRAKAAGALLFSICFVAMGLVGSQKHPVIGWLAVWFFSLGVLAGVAGLLPGAAYLRLDSEGFEAGSFRRGRKTRWQDVAGFYISSVSGAKMIAVTFSPEFKPLENARKIVGSLTGMQGGIANMYTAPLEEILAALNSWKDRFGAGKAPQIGSNDRDRAGHGGIK